MEPTEIMTAGQSPAVAQQITQAEVDMQVATAKKFPRSLDRAVKAAKTMATKSQQIAEGCFYVLPRAGKKIQGPSVRLAEILASTWGNLRAESRIVEEGARHVTAQATVWDMETNVLVRQEIRRRITNRDGKRYNDDMINTTCQAATSIALRNAMFRVVPRSIIDEVYQTARQVAVGDAQTLDSRRTRMVEQFSKLGVDQERLLARIGVGALADVGLDKLEDLIGLFNAIRDGEITLDDAFPEPQATDKDDEKETSKPSKSRSQEVAEAIGGGAKLSFGDVEKQAKAAKVPDEAMAAFMSSCDINPQDKRTFTAKRLEALAAMIDDFAENGASQDGD
jgi:hypothetical protein